MIRARIISTVGMLGLLLAVPGENASRLYGKHDRGIGPCCPLGSPTFVPAQAEPADPPTPAVKLKVRVPASSAPGEPIEYQIHVENCSAADAHHVVVKNSLPPNAKLVRASPEPHTKAPNLEWRLGTVKAGGGCDITMVLSPTNKEDIKNCTRVTFEHGQCVTTRQAAFPPMPSEKEPPTMPGADEAQLTLVIDGPKKQYANLATRYFLTVKNVGKAAATNLLVEFSPAEKTAFVTASDDGKFLAGKVAWLLGNLEAGASRTVVAAIEPKATGELCHEASALADKGVKAKARFCTIFAGISALNIDMKDRIDPLEVGGLTSYPITIYNQGTAPLTNVRIRAFVPDGLALTRATGPADNKLGEAVQGAQTLEYQALPALSEGERKTFEVFVKGLKPGDYRFRVQIFADQLDAGPVLEEESTRIYTESDIKGKALSRVKNGIE